MTVAEVFIIIILRVGRGENLEVPSTRAYSPNSIVRNTPPTIGQKRISVTISWTLVDSAVFIIVTRRCSRPVSPVRHPAARGRQSSSSSRRRLRSAFIPPPMSLIPRPPPPPPRLHFSRPICCARDG